MQLAADGIIAAAADTTLLSLAPGEFCTAESE